MLRIALVEDNPADAALLETALRKTGLPVQVVVLEDGVEAIEYITAAPGKCDLLLVDLNIPRLSGFEVLERIKSDEEFRGLPTVVISGSSDPAEIEHCYQAGANSYICKPVHLDDLFVMAAQLVTYWSRCVKTPSKGVASAGTAEYRGETRAAG